MPKLFHSEGDVPTVSRAAHKASYLPKIVGHVISLPYLFNIKQSRPRCLSRNAGLTGNQEVAGSIPAGTGNILSWRLIMKYVLRSVSPFH